MVGFLEGSAIKLKQEEEEEKELIQAEELNKSINPLDFCLQEFEKDLSFADSLLDLDYLESWAGEEGDQGPYMAELAAEIGLVDQVKDEFGGFEKSLEIGKEEVCEKNSAEGQFGHFIKEEKVELEGFEESLEMSKEDICEESNGEDGSGKLGHFGTLIEEGMGRVTLGGVRDGDVVGDENGDKGVDELVGALGNGVESGEVVTGKCEVERTGEIVGGNGDKKCNEFVVIDRNVVKNGETTAAKCEGEKNCEILGAVRDDVDGNILNVDCNGSKSGVKVSDEESDSESESESDSESEPESESSSSSSSSSSWSSKDDNEEEEKEKEEGEVDVEEGEVRDVGDEMVAWSEDDEDLGSVKAGPIMSKNEIKFLPPVPPVAVTLQPRHQTLPVGVVLSIVGAQVIVEGVENHNPLNEGSILWITEKRSPLGIVDEIFGPVKSPYYIVRYNSDSDVPDGIQQGTAISFVPEFVNHVLNNGNLYKKGYDASGENDEELTDEAEFSDDEKEAEYKRMLKMSKRGTKDQTFENRKKHKNKFRNHGGQSDQHFISPATSSPLHQGNSSHSLGPVQGFSSGPSLHQGSSSHSLGPVQGFSVGSSSHQGNSSRSSGPIQGFSGGPGLHQGNSSNPPGPVQGFFGGPGLVPTFPQFNSGGVWVNGAPFQQPPNMGFPNGFRPNNTPWTPRNHPQQQPFQMPLPNGMPFQPQFSSNQMLPSNFVLSGGQPNFCAGPTFAPWNPMLIGQNSFNQSHAAMGMPGQHAGRPIIIGEQGGSTSGLRIEQNSNPQALPAIPGNNGAAQTFNQHSGFGRGKKPYRRDGGRCGRGRGRQQPK